MKIIYGIIAIAIIALIGFFGWKIGRKINYSLSYESMVEQTIKDMVKEECLKIK